MKTNQIITLKKNPFLHILLFFFIFFFGFIHFSSAQSYNYFRQATSDTSDYFINIEWSINTPSGGSNCDCVPFANSNHDIRYLTPNFFDDVLLTTESGQQANPWVGMTATNTSYPDYSIQFRGIYYNNNATYNSVSPSVPCIFGCSYTVNHSLVTMASQPLKNAKNFKIFHEDDGSARMTWDVVTDIPYGYELWIKRNGTVIKKIYDKNTITWTDLCPEDGDVYSLTTFFFDGSTIIASTTLKRYAEKLMSPAFLRVHNSYLIGRAFIKTYIPNHNKLILHNTQEIPVSRSRKNAVMNYLKTMMV